VLHNFIPRVHCNVQCVQVINFYMNLLMERGSHEGYPRVYSFNTFFYPKLMSGGHAAVRRWTKQVDLFSYDFVLIPVHLGVHWCLAVSMA
jgi:sentrin-specific protease 1